MDIFVIATVNKIHVRLPKVDDKKPHRLLWLIYVYIQTGFFL